MKARSAINLVWLVTGFLTIIFELVMYFIVSPHSGIAIFGMGLGTGYLVMAITGLVARYIAAGKL